MDINKLLYFLNIDYDKVEKTDAGAYTVTLKDSNQLDRVLTKLYSADLDFSDDPEEFELDADHEYSVLFNDDFNVEVDADFKDDVYTVNIYEVK